MPTLRPSERVRQTLRRDSGVIVAIIPVAIFSFAVVRWTYETLLFDEGSMSDVLQEMLHFRVG